MQKTITLATRESPLALWQAHYVKALLENAHNHVTVEIMGMTTQGDQIIDVALSKVGGKGLFIKELETALLSGAADIAVHSMKDVPMDLPEGLEITALCERANPYDAFVSNTYRTPEQLPQNATVGTSSLRRSCQLKHWRPDLNIQFLRGNVQTRLKKLDEGQYDAIILACAGLERLELHGRIASAFDSETMLPATGQGAVGIECRSDNMEIHKLLSAIHDDETAVCVQAERAFNNELNGGCHAPVAAFSELRGNELTLRGRVGSIDGSTLLKVDCVIDVTLGLNHIEAVAAKLAGDIIAQGGRQLIDEALAASNT